MAVNKNKSKIILQVTVRCPHCLGNRTCCCEECDVARQLDGNSSCFICEGEGYVSSEEEKAYFFFRGS
jgi:hypothetical protein